MLILGHRWKDSKSLRSPVCDPYRNRKTSDYGIEEVYHNFQEVGKGDKGDEVDDNHYDDYGHSLFSDFTGHCVDEGPQRGSDG